MLKRRFRSVIAVAVGAIVLSLAAESEAIVTITIGKVSVFPGATATVGIFATSDTTDVLSGYNLPTDLNDDGYNLALPTGFTQAAPAFINAIYANTGLDVNAGTDAFIHADFIGTGSGSNVQLTTTPTKLFDLVFNVAPTVPVGTVMPLEIFVPAAPLASLFNIAPVNTPVALPTSSTPTFGSITVIPEPVSVAAFLLPAAAFFGRRRRSQA